MAEGPRYRYVAKGLRVRWELRKRPAGQGRGERRQEASRRSPLQLSPDGGVPLGLRLCSSGAGPLLGVSEHDCPHSLHCQSGRPRFLPKPPVSSGHLQTHTDDLAMPGGGISYSLGAFSLLGCVDEMEVSVDPAPACCSVSAVGCALGAGGTGGADAVQRVLCRASQACLGAERHGSAQRPSSSPSPTSVLCLCS